MASDTGAVRPPVSPGKGFLMMCAGHSKYTAPTRLTGILLYARVASMPIKIDYSMLSGDECLGTRLLLTCDSLGQLAATTSCKTFLRHVLEDPLRCV